MPQGPPALVLFDLELPNLGGLEILRRMRAEKRSQRPPVAILTSTIAPERACESGAVAPPPRSYPSRAGDGGSLILSQ